MTAPPPLPPDSEDDRLLEILDVMLAIAADDFTRQASVGDGSSVLDGISSGLNMLAEEVGRQRRVEAGFKSRLLWSERLAAVGALAASVAHEVNNPSAVLLANFVALDDTVQAMRDAVASGNVGALEAQFAEIQEIARVGRSNVERITSIVRALRSFARIESEKIAPVRLDEIAEQACTLMSGEITHRSRLVKDLAPVPPVMGERAKLTQVVTNLLLNAAHDIDNVDPRRHLVELTTSEEGNQVVLRIRDSGHGVSEPVRARVFEPFLTNKDGHTTGLGLSVSADIARQHGGELRYEVSDSGTTFELRLPKAAEHGADRGTAPSVAPASSRRRILVIDDEPDLLRAYVRMLGSRFDVVTAQGGMRALEVLRRDRAWDAILCDVLMPGVDGPAVWEWLAENAVELGERIVFCSGGTFTERAESFIEAHRTRFVEKPLGREQLVGVLTAVMPSRA